MVRVLVALLIAVVVFVLVRLLVGLVLNEFWSYVIALIAAAASFLGHLGYTNG